MTFRTCPEQEAFKYHRKFGNLAIKALKMSVWTRS